MHELIDNTCEPDDKLRLKNSKLPSRQQLLQTVAREA